MALPNYAPAGRSNPFYDPGNPYGWDQSFDWMGGLGSGQRQAELHPDDYWTRLLGQQGLGGFGTRANAAQSLLKQAQSGFGAATLTNPELSWVDFANSLDMPHILNQMGGEARGEDPRKFAPIDVNWIQRM